MLSVDLHLLWSSENGWRLINFILTRKYVSLSAWEIRINIILAMNFSRKLLSNNLKLLECVVLKLKSLSVLLCFPMSLPCYIFKLLIFLLLPGLHFWHKYKPDASWSPLLECPHGRAIRTWSLPKFFVCLILGRWRVQSRGICEQDTLAPWSSELLHHSTAEPAGTGQSCAATIKTVMLLPTLRLLFLQSHDMF